MRGKMKYIRYMIFPLLILNLTAAIGFSDEDSDKLPILFKSISVKESEKLKKIVEGKDAFIDWREEEIETTPLIFNYLLNRPVMTSGILEELGIAAYQIEKDGDLLQFDDGEGFSGKFKTIYKKGENRIYLGNYIYTAGIGVPVRLSGEWASVLRYKEKDGSLEIDIDLYLKSDEQGLSKVTKNIPFIIKSVIREKADSYIESIRELSEWIHKDPAEVYNLLKDSGELNSKELNEFKERFLLLSLPFHISQVSLCQSSSH